MRHLHSRLHIRESLADVSGKLHYGPTKTRSSRNVVLPGFLRLLLEEHLEHDVGPEADALVFTAPRGAPLRNSTWHERPWEPALREAKLPLNLRIHDLMHTCASLLISQGAHVKAVQRHLGHSSPTVTLNAYMHLFPKDMKRVADGLDRLHDESQTAKRRLEQTDPSDDPEQGGDQDAV